MKELEEEAKASERRRGEEMEEKGDEGRVRERGLRKVDARRRRGMGDKP